MAIHYRCPKCQTADSAGDDLAGTQIRCRQCGALLQLPGARPSHHVAEPGVIPPAPPPVPSTEARPERRRDEEYDEYPRRRDLDRDEDYGLGRGEPPAGWTTVRTGLGMMFWSAIAIVILIVFVVIGAVAVAGMAAGGPGQFGRRGEGPAIVVAIFGVCSILIAALVAFIGQCLCCAAPTHSGARGYVIGSIICTVSGILLDVFRSIIVAGGAAGGGNPNPFMPGPMEGPVLAIAVLSLGLYLAAHILFVIFLKSVARYFGDERLVRGINGYLILYVVMGALIGIGFVFLFTMAAGQQFGGPGPAMGPLFMVFVCIGCVLFLAAFVWYLVLLAQTRGVIGRSLARPGY